MTTSVSALTIVEALLAKPALYAKAFRGTFDALREAGVAPDIAATEARVIAMMAVVPEVTPELFGKKPEAEA
jgi:hypothetical protein